MIDLRITNETLNIPNCINWIMAPQAGGIDVFIGTVRDQTKGKKVVRLEFEAYEKMALNEMKKIANEMIQRWPLHKVLIHHRVGILQIGEVPVVIAVSASHRAAAFEACRYAIDTLKQTVPIWKKEVFENGEEWVDAHP
jgi:molybdopterin synthase catalytic subunit